jgi:hypothetical protein
VTVVCVVIILQSIAASSTSLPLACLVILFAVSVVNLSFSVHRVSKYQSGETRIDSGTNNDSPDRGSFFFLHIN